MSTLIFLSFCFSRLTEFLWDFKVPSQYTIMNLAGASNNEEGAPKRPSRLSTKNKRTRDTKKSQSLPVIKTPLYDLRLTTNSDSLYSKGSVDNLILAPFEKENSDSTLYMSGEENFQAGQASPAWDNKDPPPGLLMKVSPKAKERLARLTSLVKCPSSSSLHRPLGFATEQLLRQTSSISTGSLKSLCLNDGVNSFDTGRSHQLPPIARNGSPPETTRRVTELKRLHHSWTVTGMSQLQDSVDCFVYPTDRPSVLQKISTKDARLR